MVLFIVIFCVVVTLGFGLVAAWSDFRGLTIPNMYSAAIAGLFIPAFLVQMIFAPEAAYFSTWQSHTIAAGSVFAVTFILFSVRLIGAGDSKLLSAYALWTGLSGLPSLLFFMAVCGGVLGVVAVAVKVWKPVENPHKGGWIDKAQSGASAVPYGIAIAFGAVIAFWQLGYFEPERLAALNGYQ